MTRGPVLVLAALVAGACGGSDRDRAPEGGAPAPARDTIRLTDDPAPLDSAAADSVPSDPAPADSAPADSAPRAAPVDPSGPTAGWTAGILQGDPDPDGIATLVEVRAGRHPGFDRLVWTFREGRPGWKVEYVDRPVRECGSGRSVPLPGDGWLEVRFEPARSHDDEGRSTAGALDATPGLARVLSVARTCDFEAVVVFVLAVDSPEPYRVLELDDPPRLVVDVRHAR
ncbi:MAG TPA: hypothetical protein VM778_05725 [Gemmatimonadota bacterium]|nr:hypothetical protein [Gemmatimonadota bacterium]